MAACKRDLREKSGYHLLTDIITIAILGVIAGALGWEDIEEYGLNIDNFNSQIKSLTTSFTEQLRGSFGNSGALMSASSS
ncbi:transposase family protein [Nostoc sp.]|uniref:transposase family protein n=1 Tax=Nostoc sp. TaxID=1180 RepID=UPI003FA5691E